jgi:hypothetical protein
MRRSQYPLTSAQRRKVAALVRYGWTRKKAIAEALTLIPKRRRFQVANR